MSFCIKCGNKLADDAIFCSECGYKVVKKTADETASVEDAVKNDEVISETEEITTAEPVSVEEAAASPEETLQSEAAPLEGPAVTDENVTVGEASVSTDYENIAYLQSNPKKGRKLIAGIVAFVVLVALIVTAILTFGNDQSNPGEVMKKYVKAINDEDGEDLLEIVYPKAMIKAMGENKEELEEYFEDMTEYLVENAETRYGRGARFSTRIIDIEYMDEEEIARENENHSDDNIKIDNVCRVKLEQSIRSFEDSETQETSVTLYKVGGKWYLLGLW